MGSSDLSRCIISCHQSSSFPYGTNIFIYEAQVETNFEQLATRIHTVKRKYVRASNEPFGLMHQYFLHDQNAQKIQKNTWLTPLTH